MTAMNTANSITSQNPLGYYVFGSKMPGRNANPGEYRYGFQNQEEDPELMGGSVAFKYRIHDPRIGRFLSVDPLTMEYPWNSTYAFSENRVTNSIDLEGLEAVDIAGNLHAGPVELQVINDEILKAHPEYMMDPKHITNVNAKILTSGFRQDLYPHPIEFQKLQPKQEEPPVIEFNISSEAGLALKGKAKVFGVGGKLEFGFSQPLTSVTYTEKGPKTKLFGRPQLGMGYGAGAFGVSTDLISGSTNGNIALYKLGIDDIWTEPNGFQKIEVFDFAIQILGGASTSLTLNIPSTDVQPSQLYRSNETAPADATGVSLNILSVQELRSIIAKQNETTVISDGGDSN